MIATLTLSDVVVAGGAGRRPALDGVDLAVAPGRVTGLVGASGAGKSTVLALLARLRDPDAGTIRCGEEDLLAVAREAWWPKVAWLPQRPALLRGPLRETLTLQAGEAGGCAGAARDAVAAEEIAVALERAGAAEVVAELEEGLETVVGAGGRGLSGGQRQRLALAGALLSRAPLLLLDEPTAHLDPDAAARAAAGIRAAAAGQTVVVATHDPAVVAICDDLIELRDGRVLSVARDRDSDDTWTVAA